eukprot:Rhum_TRINITY_DN14452_c15_g1::Rhum_TRINITY_DN14452_c15_g1_i1::g.92514::m.92514/K00826/E2.6.1.42, ilvE; branched-chain amino acid aminotransferase
MKVFAPRTLLTAARGVASSSAARSAPRAPVAAAAAPVQRRSYSDVVGSAEMDWQNLGFEYRDTNCFVNYTWKDGKWDAGVLQEDPHFKMHVMSAAVHYGQGLFEGTKAHHCADGSVRLWNIDGNAARMQQGAQRMMIPEVPREMFVEACERAVAANLAFLPPYGTGGSLYLRPVLFGHGPQLGLCPAPQYTFAVLALPVSSYYKTGLNPVSALVVENDRAAPAGVGNVKCSGNYGADILPSIQARERGFSTVLYVDPKKKQHIEEFSVSNFIGIKHDDGSGRKVYVTPKSDSILMSCTNKMLMEMAPMLGFDVEHRPVHVNELATFDEVAGCGTAVVLMGVKDVTRRNTKISYPSIDNVKALYDMYRGIQFGEVEDAFKWSTPLQATARSPKSHVARQAVPAMERATALRVGMGEAQETACEPARPQKKAGSKKAKALSLRRKHMMRRQGLERPVEHLLRKTSKAASKVQSA